MANFSSNSPSENKASNLIDTSAATYNTTIITLPINLYN